MRLISGLQQSTHENCFWARFTDEPPLRPPHESNIILSKTKQMKSRVSNSMNYEHYSLFNKSITIFISRSKYNSQIKYKCQAHSVNLRNLSISITQSVDYIKKQRRNDWKYVDLLSIFPLHFVIDLLNLASLTDFISSIDRTRSILVRALLKESGPKSRSITK